MNLLSERALAMAVTGESGRVVIGTSVDVDVMYYWMAVKALRRVKRARRMIEPIEAEWRVAEAQERAALERHGGDEMAAYDEIEPISIHMMDSLHPELEAKYSFYFEQVSLVYVFIANALEAHINSKAMGLERRWFEAFDKLSLEGKWMFFPKVRGSKGVDPGEELFRKFTRLVAVRNKFMHFKQNTNEPWIGGRVPSFVMKEEFSVRAAEEAVEAAKGMIRKMAEGLSEQAPDWLESQPSSYFGFRL